MRAPLYDCMQGGCELVIGESRQRQISSSVPLPACMDTSAFGLLLKGFEYGSGWVQCTWAADHLNEETAEMISSWPSGAQAG